MRGDSVAAMWPTLEVIRDIYSKASQGVLLTWVALWDAKTAFRSAAYQRLGLQDHLSTTIGLRPLGASIPPASIPLSP